MSTLIIQPSNIDTTLFNDAPTSNYGTQAWLVVENYATIGRAVLKFDFSALPSGAVISAATLKLYYYSAAGYSPAGRTHWAYELTQTDWVEAQATWNIYKTGSNWTTAGGDYVTGDGASTTVPSSYGWMSWNVLALVQHFQSAHGKVAHFLIRDGTESGTTRGVYLRSREYATDTTLRPKLEITYTTGQAYTITAEAGSYALTGQGAAIKLNRKIAAGAGSYALTGQAAGLKVDRKIAADAGSYPLTGQGAGLKVDRKIAAGAGSYALTGQDADLVLHRNYIIEAEQGCYGEPYSKTIVTLDGRVYKKIGNTYLRLQ